MPEPEDDPHYRSAREIGAGLRKCPASRPPARYGPDRERGAFLQALRVAFQSG